MSNVVERDWTTAAGLRAVCMMTTMGHRCGYDEVPQGHPLHGLGYSDTTDAIVFDPESVEIGKKSPILALTAGVGAAPGETIRRSPDIAFDVHGGLTFSGGGRGYPVESDGWWFGFDCAHAGDLTRYSDGVERTEEYVVSECESLAAQIVAAVPLAARRTTDGADDAPTEAPR